MADRRLALVGCHQSMPTRRTPIDRGRRVQITLAMVALWKRGQEILATKAEQKWEEEGGRRREFLDLAVELHELLDRRPWEVDVFYVDAMKIGASASRADSINHCFGFVGVATKVYDNARASGCERQRSGPPHSAESAGYKCSLVSEAGHHNGILLRGWHSP
jgi:hypothetical protein